MKNIIYLLTLTFLWTGCTDDLKDATDFTSVENPNLEENDIVGKSGSTAIWLNGIEREMSVALNEILILAELGSDNYKNVQTFYNQFLDNLEIKTTDPDISDTQFRIARVREMVKFGLETIGPNDVGYSKNQEAELLFFEGMSYLYAGMYFSALPSEKGAAAVSANENLRVSINLFTKANDLITKPEYMLAAARANYYLGNKSEAVSFAQDALNLNSSFLRSIKFDQQNTTAVDNTSNAMESALYERGTFDDLQPLPSLDFLDPKYSFLSSQEDPSVHILKAEEAYLILAEANLSDNNLASAQFNLTKLLNLVATREVRTIDDSVEDRLIPGFPPVQRPDSTVTVNNRIGLVLYRKKGKVNIPSVSGTSLTQGDVDTLSLGDDALELLYRTRQEIFIAEGIRLVDMGVKLVIHEEEISQNENINFGDPSTIPVIPSFIESNKGQLDAYIYNEKAGTVLTQIDLNEILVNNKTSGQVLPFH